MNTRYIKVKTYSEFYQDCNSFFEDGVRDDGAYHYIVDGDSKEIRDIVHLYQTLQNKDFYPEICKKISMTIEISEREDLVSFFLNSFCECLETGKWRIKRIYYKVDFFCKTSDTGISSHEEVLKWFDKFNSLRNEEKYPGVAERISTVSHILFQNEVYILIFKEEDYSTFFQFVDSGAENWTVKKEDRNKRFIFLVGYSGENISPMLLHNYLLFCNKFEAIRYSELHVSIPTDDVNLIFDGWNRIQIYLLNNQKEQTFINEIKIKWEKEKKDGLPKNYAVGKLPPAIHVRNNEELAFFSKPIQEWVWKRIIEISSRDSEDERKKHRITEETFGEGTLEWKFWSYLRICQKYLLEPYDEIQSKPYQALRDEAYRSEEFYKKYISRMPLLAVCFFAFYDGFYRSNLLIEWKERATTYNESFVQRDEDKVSVDLRIEDILLSEQRRQNWSNYSMYESIKGECDVKNLLVESDGEKIKFHKTIEAEIFEAISIAEGLLQIIENGVVHAGGALLSMRVYNRAKGVRTREPKEPEHITYLDKVYSEKYFKASNAKFFLEVQVSDLSKQSIPDKYCKNLKEDTETWTNLEGYYRSSARALEDVIEKVDTDFFFRKRLSDELEEFKDVFYKINKNLVHHYGLEIFNAIITARKGLFSVVGHGTGYDNIADVLKKSNIEKRGGEEEARSELEQTEEMEAVAGKIRKKIQGNKNLCGTTYRMILPLNHTVVKNTPAVNNEIVIQEQINKISIPREVKLDELLDNVIYGDGVREKQKRIDVIANNILKKYEGFEGGELLCVNLYGNSSCDMEFEVIVKGILLFGLNRISDNGYLPIAVIHLTPFQLIEATRIISVYYTKNSKHSEESVFKRMPIYLKCHEIGKEVIFEGADKSEVRENLVRNAILSGTMFDELQTIVEILKKVEN